MLLQVDSIIMGVSLIYLALVVIFEGVKVFTTDSIIRVQNFKYVQYGVTFGVSGAMMMLISTFYH